jgi:hypothetical protein
MHHPTHIVSMKRRIREILLNWLPKSNPFGEAEAQVIRGEDMELLPRAVRLCSQVNGAAAELRRAAKHARPLPHVAPARYGPDPVDADVSDLHSAALCVLSGMVHGSSRIDLLAKSVMLFDSTTTWPVPVWFSAKPCAFEVAQRKCRGDAMFQRACCALLIPAQVSICAASSSK